jgi:hydroxymethylbilane synthase
MLSLNNSLYCIKIASRQSPLAKVQVTEVYRALRALFPDIAFDTTYMSTKGDDDQKTSLRKMEKTDFFTQEVDQHLLSGQSRAAIHSAKDLPNPISEGLSIAAITKGVNSSDSLVLRDGETVDTLSEDALIATSSERREETVRMLRSDLQFCDIRGNIQQRLAKLESGEVDGVVIAEAALIRLELTQLNRVTLPGATTALQGQLAILVRSDDETMKKLFSVLDSRT